ncbi:MAG: hypothetical protein D6732_13730 [Methanobacteriota archaeon]|nr:MAG: hypothetical protein D6732_13730 [Euryarchaeota archaeon]
MKLLNSFNKNLIPHRIGLVVMDALAFYLVFLQPKDELTAENFVFPLISAYLIGFGVLLSFLIYGKEMLWSMEFFRERIEDYLMSGSLVVFIFAMPFLPGHVNVLLAIGLIVFSEAYSHQILGNLFKKCNKVWRLVLGLQGIFVLLGIIFALSSTNVVMDGIQGNVVPFWLDFGFPPLKFVKDYPLGMTIFIVTSTLFVYYWVLIAPHSVVEGILANQAGKYLGLSPKALGKEFIFGVSIALVYRFFDLAL